MKKLIVMMMLVGGVAIFGGAVFAGGSGAAGTSGAAGVSGLGVAGDSSAFSTREGDVSGTIPSTALDPTMDPSSAARREYPAASPPSGTVVVPPAGTVVVPAPGVVVTPGTTVIVPRTVVVPVPSTPLMCPRINASDPRLC